MLPPTDLRGRRAVITGAASGIGRAIALRLAQAGARILAIDIDKQRLLNEIERDEWAGTDITPVVADLGEDPDADPVRLADDLLGADGPIELIVNNVGICSGTMFLDTDPGRYRRVMRTNLDNPWFFTKRLVEALIEAERSGAILFVSSLHERFVSNRPQYSMSKAGVSMGTRELAAELGQYGIRVNAISPGWIMTRPRSNRRGETGKAERLTPLIPLGRPGRPDDVAKLALFLLSDECSGYLTGVNIPVDGGLSLHSWVSRDEPIS
jgi:NAD(P)-dependent dehydrogenase (short-subunit alcohol dehydrogenase family)